MPYEYRLYGAVTPSFFFEIKVFQQSARFSSILNSKLAAFQDNKPELSNDLKCVKYAQDTSCYIFNGK